jgi:hypothetical protein
MLATEDIAIQPYQNCCAHATIFNLFKVRGFEPPAFEELDERLELCARAYGRKDASGGSTYTEVQNVLAGYDFLTAAVAIPFSSMREPHKILTRFLDARCNLIIFFTWRSPEDGKTVPHITLAEGYNEKGYQVIDGEPGYYAEGTPIELEPKLPLDGEEEAVKRWIEIHSHGSRRLLPFYSVAMFPDNPLGLAAHVLIVFPDSRSEANG